MARTLDALDVALPAPSDQGFTDIDGNLHRDRINQLAAAGIVAGTAPGIYAPAQHVRRDQMATFLVRTYEYAAQRLSASQDHFTDTQNNPHEESINKAAEAGFTAGTEPGIYSPALAVRRDQMASFIARMLSAADRVLVEGGTLVWGHDQEPSSLNPTTTDGNMFATSQVALAVLLPLWIITPDFSYEPSPLLDSVGLAVAGGDFTVTYNLNPDATWSDGRPITAGDVFFTLETCLDQRWDIASRTGCDRVDMDATGARLDPDSKTIELVFTEPYGPWQTLFSTASGVILPRHVLEGEDWNTVWSDEITVASGPFMFEEWDRGVQLTIVRNPRYEAYADRNAHLGRIVFRFLPDSDTQIQQLRDGDIDMFYPQPELDLVQRVEAIDGVESEASAGPIWEHLDFQQLNPALVTQYVRQAVAKGIDRETFIEQFIRPLNADAEPLNSLVYLSNQTQYEPHFEGIVDYDPLAAIAILENNGCQRGDDGIFVCDTERLSFEWTSTAGDERRERFFEIAQQSLLEIGVEVTPDFGEAAAVFAADKLDAGNWDLFNFEWVGSPDPAANVERWKCQGTQNYHRDCPPAAVDERLEETNRTVDPDERARLMDEAGAMLAERVPVLPLYQLPTYLAWNGTRVTGLRDNPTRWGPVWNMAEWRAVSD